MCENSTNDSAAKSDVIWKAATIHGSPVTLLNFMKENTLDRMFRSFWIFGLKVAYATILINPFSWLFIAYTKKVIEENKGN